MINRWEVSGKFCGKILTPAVKGNCSVDLRGGYKRGKTDGFISKSSGTDLGLIQLSGNSGEVMRYSTQQP